MASSDRSPAARTAIIVPGESVAPKSGEDVDCLDRHIARKI